MVLGGYSQGAMVIDQITIAQFPVAGFVPETLSADQADHVAALALFGNPSDRYLGAPVSTVSPWYGAKALDLCAPGDAICTPGGSLSLPMHDEMFSRHTSPIRIPECRRKPQLSSQATCSQRGMRAVIITKHGPPSVLEVQSRPDPPPSDGQVRIAVRAAGVNFADHLTRVGLYPHARRNRPGACSYPSGPGGT